MDVIDLDALHEPESEEQKAKRELAVLLHYGWNNPEADWFYADLLRLIRHADPENRIRLGYAFPYAVVAVEHWERTGKVPE